MRWFSDRRGVKQKQTKQLKTTVQLQHVRDKVIFIIVELKKIHAKVYVAPFFCILKKIDNGV